MMNTGPKYLRLAGELRQQIALGELAPDAQLPTEWRLVEQHGLSRGTVRQALTVLEQAGLIRREQGRGMFVNPSRPRLTSFALSEPVGGASVAGLRTPCAEVTAAGADVASKLDLEAGTPVFHVIQVRYTDAAPVMHEERYFARHWYPQLLDTEIGQTPLHWILVHKAKLPLVRMEHSIDVRLPNADEAALLQIATDAPLFVIERRTFTSQDGAIIPAVWYRALCRGSDYQLRAEFLASI